MTGHDWFMLFLGAAASIVALSLGSKAARGF